MQLEPGALQRAQALLHGALAAGRSEEALKQLQPVQSVTPSKLSLIASKKQQTTSVPPLKINQEKLDQQSKEAGNIQVHAQASTSSSRSARISKVVSTRRRDAPSRPADKRAALQ